MSSAISTQEFGNCFVFHIVPLINVYRFIAAQCSQFQWQGEKSFLYHPLGATDNERCAMQSWDKAKSANLEENLLNFPIATKLHKNLT